MTSPVPMRQRLGRGVCKWSLIGAGVLYAGMAASLVWNVLLPVWMDSDARPEKWHAAANMASLVLLNGAIAAVAIAVVGWIVRFALTRERALWPDRPPTGEPREGASRPQC